MAKNIDTVPIEVSILTADHDIKGIVHVSKYTNTNRELTDLLNDRERRFLAVTNAEIYPRNSNREQLSHLWIYPKTYRAKLQVVLHQSLQGSDFLNKCFLQVLL